MRLGCGKKRDGTDGETQVGVAHRRYHSGSGTGVFVVVVIIPICSEPVWEQK